MTKYSFTIFYSLRIGGVWAGTIYYIYDPPDVYLLESYILDKHAGGYPGCIIEVSVNNYVKYYIDWKG